MSFRNTTRLQIRLNELPKGTSLTLRFFFFLYFIRTQVTKTYLITRNNNKKIIFNIISIIHCLEANGLLSISLSSFLIPYNRYKVFISFRYADILHSCNPRRTLYSETTDSVSHYNIMSLTHIHLLFNSFVKLCSDRD